MTSLITPARIVARLNARNTRQVVKELTGIAADTAALDHEAVCDAVLERGRMSCFGFGRGVAIPHATIPVLDRPMGVFARLRPAQDFGAADGIPADLVLLLLSPDDDDPTHLRALACAARRLRDRDLAVRLRSAKDAEALHILLIADALHKPGYETETGHSATLRPCDLTNGLM